MLKEKYLGECKTCEGQGYLNNHDECVDCGGNGFESELIGEDEIVFVNIYSVTREYGGPEEGGWWYNCNDCIEVVPVANKNSDLMKELMEKKYASHKHGNIYSVLGGRDIEVEIESEPQQSETRERPHYE